jgi:hypothetical protein
MTRGGAETSGLPELRSGFSHHRAGAAIDDDRWSPALTGCPGPTAAGPPAQRDGRIRPRCWSNAGRTRHTTAIRPISRPAPRTSLPPRTILPRGSSHPSAGADAAGSVRLQETVETGIVEAGICLAAASAGTGWPGPRWRTSCSRQPRWPPGASGRIQRPVASPPLACWNCSALNWCATTKVLLTFGTERTPVSAASRLMTAVGIADLGVV